MKKLLRKLNNVFKVGRRKPYHKLVEPLLFLLWHHPSLFIKLLLLFSQTKFVQKLKLCIAIFGGEIRKKTNGGCFLKSWDSICSPKSEGGLGIKKMADMNKALVAKLTWEVVSNEDKIWVTVLTKKYVRNRNIMKIYMPKNASWASQSIFTCREVIKKGMCHRIGNDYNTWIWEDPWIPNEPGFIPQAKSGAIDNVHLVVDLIDQDTRQWDRGKLSILFEPTTVNRILNIHLPY